MLLSEKVGIKGRAQVILRRTSKEIQMLEELQKKEWETGERILRDPDRQKLEDAIEQEHTVDNLTMTRAIDYMVSLLGRSYGFGLNTVTLDDRNSISNNTQGIAEYANIVIKSLFGPISTVPALFPEIIGIGKGITPPTLIDTTLDDDFNSYVSRPDNITYRNTYNSKYGGYVKPGLTFKDDYIAQYAYIYGPDEINNLDFPIFEIGLFSPLIQMGLFRIHPTSDQILFDRNTVGYETNNRLWSGLNISRVILNGDVFTHFRLSGPTSILPIPLGFNSFRGQDSQSITLIGSAAIADGSARALVTFTPFWKSMDAGVDWGIRSHFDISELIARAVLPMGFIKNQNYSLTVLWQIYFERM